jgi:hypothetical protein
VTPISSVTGTAPSKLSSMSSERSASKRSSRTASLSIWRALSASASVWASRMKGTSLTAEPVAWTDDFANDPVRQQQWAPLVRRSVIANAPERFASAASAVQTLLKLIVEACLAGHTVSSSWQARGPWRAPSG